MSKYRPVSHLTGEIAIDIVKSKLPKEWVIRQMTPDYGIDLHIELFDYLHKDKKMCETLGEFLYVQVKGTEKLKKRKIKVHPVYNVAKAEWKENPDEYVEIDVVNYSLETGILETVKRAGVSVCVLLFVVDTIKKDVYFICLNDLLDKLIIPQNPSYIEQGTVTIDIPMDNKVTDQAINLVPLRLYGKRSKFYSAFSLIRYQIHELRRELDLPEIAFLDEEPDAKNLAPFLFKKLSQFIIHFANQLLRLDIWSVSENMLILGYCKENLDKLVKSIQTGKWEDNWMANHQYYTMNWKYPTELSDIIVLKTATMTVWNQLHNINNVYEEICREWFLPKFIGILGSYENRPKIKKSNK